MTTISIVTGCYNEEDNVAELYRRVRAVLESLAGYEYEHLFIDNASTDRTVAVLRDLCAQDPRVKVIINTRNFGHVRSPYHGLLQAHGDAVCCIAADLQDPPELIREFVAKWEEGHKVVVGVKSQSVEKRSMFFLRGLYYRLINRLSDVPLIANFTATGSTTGSSSTRYATSTTRTRTFAASSATLATNISRSPMCSSAGSAVSPRTTSTPSTTSRCWASRTTPKCPSAWP